MSEKLPPFVAEKLQEVEAGNDGTENAEIENPGVVEVLEEVTGD